MRGSCQGIRWPDEMRNELIDVSSKSGFSVSDVVRMAVRRFLDDVRDSGSITIPVRAANETQMAVTIQDRLNSIRLGLDLEEGELAAKLQISRTMLHYLYTGERRPSMKLFRKIKALEMSVHLKKGSGK